MKDNAKELLNDILYMLEVLDEEGFSNQRIKQSIQENVKDIAKILNLEVNEMGGYVLIDEIKLDDDEAWYDEVLNDYESEYEK